MTLVPPQVIGGLGHIPPSEKINLACIGVGGKGTSDILGLYSTGQVNVVALCEIDWKRDGVDNLLEKFPEAKRYQDYRLLLGEMGDKIDAVSVSTPDHVHAPASMAAMKMGKHVFCQKPLTHNLYEARLMAQTAREKGVATLMGIQGHSGEGMRLIYEWIHQGAIGKVKEVRIWTDRPHWPQGVDRPTKEDPIPEGFAWNEWLGPAPYRPFVQGVYHPGVWRGWFDFGAGAMGDIGCHSFDAPFWVLNLGYPTSVEATSSPVFAETYPKWSTITYEFPSRGKMPPVRLMWYDGRKEENGQEVQNMPPRPDGLEEDRKLQENGQLYIGEDGAIMAGMYAESPRIIPEKRMKEFLESKPEKTLERSHGHYVEFVEACKGERPAGANFEYSGPLTEVVHLGNIAVRAQTKIEFDPKAMKITNCDSADALLKRTYREGWTL